MRFGVASRCVALVSLLCASTACSEPPCAGGAPTLRRALRPTISEPLESVDMLFAIDNSGSMASNQRSLTQTFGVLVEALTNPPLVRDPATGVARPRSWPAKSLHVAVVSSDLGTPGTMIPDCANADTGDDGLFNPVRVGLSTRSHPPWASAPPGARPARCTNDPAQYPSFLTFSSGFDDAAAFAEDFACVAYLSTFGCGIEQQLESVYRALVVRNPRAGVANTDPNAGFVRENALLSIVMVTDEEDGSTRDCRFAEAGVGCNDAVSVFDPMSPDWSSSDLNLRFYLYTPGTRQDPTWPLDRYIDPARPARGFTSLKPGHPERVIFSAIAGAPLAPPTRTVDGATEIDWDALLGRNPDGSDGYVGTSPEGPVSMRQRNLDPACPTRVVPACRREGSAPTAACTLDAQYFAWPSRRVALVARRFAERYQNGTLSSICARDDRAAVDTIVGAIRRRLNGGCPDRLPTVPVRCDVAPSAGCARTGDAIRLNCTLREILPAGVSAAAACTAARGRTPGGTDPDTRRDVCVIRQVPVALGGAPAAGVEGFFYDTRTSLSLAPCNEHVELTERAALLPGAMSRLDCLDETVATSASGEACGGGGAVGVACVPTRPENAPCVAGDTRGCLRGFSNIVESGSRACASGLCIVDRFGETPTSTAAERARGMYCSCRCAVPSDLAASIDPSSLCACPEGFACRDFADAAFSPSLRGSYCVRQ